MTRQSFLQKKFPKGSDSYELFSPLIEYCSIYIQIVTDSFGAGKFVERKEKVLQEYHKHAT